MAIDVVPYRPAWPHQFERVARRLRGALAGLPSAEVEHVGSTSVPGLAAKPIIDIDVVVDREDIAAAVSALEAIGYLHRRDLGVTDREAFTAPDDAPRRQVYVCRQGTLSVRNHLAVRDVLRAHPALRAEYGAVKLALAADPEIDMELHRGQVRGVAEGPGRVRPDHRGTAADPPAQRPLGAPMSSRRSRGRS